MLFYLAKINYSWGMGEFKINAYPHFRSILTPFCGLLGHTQTSILVWSPTCFATSDFIFQMTDLFRSLHVNYSMVTIIKLHFAFCQIFERESLGGLPWRDLPSKKHGYSLCRCCILIHFTEVFYMSEAIAHLMSEKPWGILLAPLES